MKNIVNILLMTTIIGFILVGIPKEIFAQRLTSKSIIIPDFTTQNFHGEVSVTYNSNTENYTITAPIIGGQSPGGWHYQYTIIEQTSAREITRGSGGSVWSFTTSFKDTGDTHYRLTLDSVDDLWGQRPGYTAPRSTLIIQSGKSTNVRATVFEDTNKGGQSFENVGPIKRPDFFAWNMNDKISSINLQPKTKITIFDDINYGGGSRTFMNNSCSAKTINLPDHNWNDRASSLEVSVLTGLEFGVNLFQNSHNGGKAIRNTRATNVADLRTIDMNDEISSVELYPNTQVTLYEDINYKGEEVTYTNNTNDVKVINLGGTWWNDKASSYKADNIK
ncbi:hypothetical protein FJO98_00055 [Enterococcus sp. PF-2]|uniref:hypothetical protein n=1 Tax=unclassified Enterococcus TaxID=2608891 RepID=UPI0011203D0C|nr:MULTISPECIES: hypothetical protein [unclassified Enterococcus]TPE08096.1 hypothetical protein FJP08_00055 [Enterococcus sp. PF-3]TPE29187.1 hypothetical protein FJO98_00055 [Enterococcus sp. PF-2]